SASHNEYVFTGSRRFGTPTVLPAIHDLHAGSREPRCWIRTAQDAVSRRGSGETGRSAMVHRWRHAAGLIVGHQDTAPYNAVVDGERLVGFYDWDIAGPSSREWDLAFSMLPWAPLASPSP